MLPVYLDYEFPTVSEIQTGLKARVITRAGPALYLSYIRKRVFLITIL